MKQQKKHTLQCRDLVWEDGRCRLPADEAERDGGNNGLRNAA